MTEQQDEARVQCMEFHITGCMFGIGAERPFPVCYHHALMHLADSTEELDGRSLDDQASQCARRVYRYTGDTGEGARAGCAAIQARARAQGVPLYRRGRAHRVYRYTGEGARAGCAATEMRARAGCTATEMRARVGYTATKIWIFLAGLF